MALLGWGGSLKGKITYNKGTFVYPFGMIAAKPLLVAGGSHHGCISHLLKLVDVHLALFLGLLLIVEVNSWSIEVKVKGEDRFCPINKEEGGVLVE